MAENTPVTLHRNERVLLVMVASCWGLSILAIVALFIGGAAGVTRAGGIWPVIAVLPIIGLPVGLLVMIAYIVVSSIRRSRESRNA